MSEQEFTEGHVEVDGFRIRYWQAGQGETVVMLGSSVWGWSPLNDALAQSYRVIVFEVPVVCAGVVDLFFQQPGVDHRDVMRQLELFGREVLPRIKEF